MLLTHLLINPFEDHGPHGSIGPTEPYGPIGAQGPIGRLGPPPARRPPPAARRPPAACASSARWAPWDHTALWAHRAPGAPGPLVEFWQASGDEGPAGALLAWAGWSPRPPSKSSMAAFENTAGWAQTQQVSLTQPLDH